MAISLLVATLLGLVGLAFVVYPLWSLGRDTSGPYDVENMEHDQSGPSIWVGVGQGEMRTEREQAARAALQEVELDYQLGNLAESDYQTLHDRYMQRALLELKSRHEREQGKEQLDDAIEEELRRMKEQDADTTT